MPYVVLVALASFLPVLTAFADAAGSSAQNPTAPSFGGLGLLIAYLTRRREIGGWLFYYYMQLYLSLALTLLLSAPYVGYLNPSKWGRTDLYVWYLFSTIPAIGSQCVETVIGTLLLIRRTEDNVRRLRFAIAALLVTTAASLAIDSKFFNQGPDAGATDILDVVTLIFATIWLVYFYKSIRVRKVFIEHNWIYVEHPPQMQTPRERRYRRNRTLLCAAIFYVIGFAIVGLAQSDKKPDPALLFGVPLVYALIAALVAHLCPIGKKKRASLLAADAPKNIPAT